MKTLTGLAISEVVEGKMITFTYSEINSEGVIVRNNERESRIVMDEDLKKKIQEVQDYVKTNLLGA
ncbi:hypothetical protein [Clostridium sardiniense]|uniref:hypothetical protein n=1 Tax=Clostridium sardiniense TaxID=29369 RepID=UPI0019598748|nr:hypothetical protein [Clostridium sardiniense]MBM7835707.1 hypothetical protein [Clostridium sardiniense]